MERDERYEVNSLGSIVVGNPVTLTPLEKKALIERMFSINGWSYNLISEITSAHYLVELKNDNLGFRKEFHLYHGNVRREDPDRNREEKKIQLGTENDPRDHMDDGLILGFYVYEDKTSLEDTVIVAWPIEPEKNYPANPSLRVNMRTDILPAKNSGYYIDTTSGKRLVAFRPEFIYHYIQNYKNVQYSPQVALVADDNIQGQSLVFQTNLDTDFQLNRIVFGAPGTGKSHRLQEDSDKLRGEDGMLERVTFHPEYSYANFVGTYKPISEAVTKEDGAQSNEITYKFVPGPFMRVLVAALKNAKTDKALPHLLLIEEINRAKVAAVFGDVFQLLDRDNSGVSEYKIHASEDIRKYLAEELKIDIDKCKEIAIPNNMFIWATMNSADQGVFPMDTAFKRRWNFEYIGIDEEDKDVYGLIDIAGKEIEWNQLRKAINKKLTDEYSVNEDKLIGPYFLSKKTIETEEVTATDGQVKRIIKNTDLFTKAFKSKVLMYLYEDAAKQHKKKMFPGCSKYSDVCNAFDQHGIKIFGDDFETLYEEQEV